MSESTSTALRGEDRPPPGERPRQSPLASEAGFTLIEVLIAAVIMVVAVTALFALVDSSVRASYATRAREGATNLARQILEDAHTIPYSEISPTAITGELQQMHGLEPKGGKASPWQVEQRGIEEKGAQHNAITYTVKVSACAIDDPKNGLGEHKNSAGENVFCKDTGEKEWEAKEEAEGKTKDPQPENLKRITAEVEWTTHTGKEATHVVTQVETLTAAGEAVGLSAYNLQLSQPVMSSPWTSTTPVITEATVKELVFTVSSPKGTTGIIWSLEGNRQSSVPTQTEKGGLTWTFSWPISAVSDGTYKITAQAVNATGVIGPPVTLAVTLIRGIPVAPTGAMGGFNTVYVSGVPKTVVELQWQPNKERNVIGYRVYRPANLPRERALVCPESAATLSLVTQCIDFNPVPLTGPNFKYEIVALYRKAGIQAGEPLSETVSEGPAAIFPVIGGEPPPVGPLPPETLTAEKNADGSVTLKWTLPKAGEVAFFRIYRGSTNYNSRYDVTGTGTATSYNDTDATEKHKYWITAVNKSLTESIVLGPVEA